VPHVLRSSRPRSRCAVARASSLRFTLSSPVAPSKSVSCSRSRVPVARAVSLSCARPDVRLPERRVGPRPPPRLRVASMRSLQGSVPRALELVRRDPVARARVERVRRRGFPRDERATSTAPVSRSAEACTVRSCLRDVQVAVRSAFRQVAPAIRASRTAREQAVLAAGSCAARAASPSKVARR